LTTAEYEERMRDEIAHVIAVQEEIGLDVLVHGEPERADMVQYFAEQLDGVLSTEHGWVQSYGTRCVRPPIIVGDVSRPGPMTISWWRHAQSLTTHPVKAMLTGPITLLRWSFPRVDVAPSETATQLALAIRDEIAELEAAGAQVIQVDEPALREGLPLRALGRPGYLSWAARAFRLATSGACPTTQIHTHMCYAEFGDILDAVVALDADVISLEAARSGMRVVDELAERGYPAAVGPGVYDIHSSRVPSVEELRAMLSKVVAALPAQRVWVNPDCGLKTRSESEVVPALRNLVAAARLMRTAVG
jgi:5-methyltetrahydropteroyltriglutamate--homocysteine methyltransferase